MHGGRFDSLLAKSAPRPQSASSCYRQQLPAATKERGGEGAEMRSWMFSENGVPTFLHFRDFRDAGAYLMSEKAVDTAI